MMNEIMLDKLEGKMTDSDLPPKHMKLKCMAGQVVFEQGTPANQAFFIEEGTVEVIMRKDGVTMKLAEIGPGEVFGEMGVMEHEARMATVKALENSTITVLSRDDLEARIKNIKDPVVSAVIKGLTKRLRASNAGQAKYFKNLAEFQNRVAGLMTKANEGIDAEHRNAFATEIEPLLDQVEAVLDKYKK